MNTPMTRWSRRTRLIFPLLGLLLFDAHAQQLPDPTCKVSLAGPADPLTGLQFTRTVRLDSDSPRIRFHTVFANASGHPIEWSVQSVTQYDTADAKDPAHHNKDIWGFSSANPTSAYLNRYHVRFGPAENSA